MTLSEIVDQLKACGYRCEAGSLEMNTAFVELEEQAEKERKNLLATQSTWIIPDESGITWTITKTKCKLV